MVENLLELLRSGRALAVGAVVAVGAFGLGITIVVADALQGDSPVVGPIVIDASDGAVDRDGSDTDGPLAGDSEPGDDADRSGSTADQPTGGPVATAPPPPPITSPGSDDADDDPDEPEDQADDGDADPPGDQDPDD